MPRLGCYRYPRGSIPPSTRARDMLPGTSVRRRQILADPE